MNRTKLEYLVKNMSADEKKRLCDLIDIDGFDDFDMSVCELLENPETKNPLILSVVIDPSDNKCVEHFLTFYKGKFEGINKYCEKCGVYPLFPNPSDLKSSSLLRKDLIKEVPEEELNKFFKVKDYIYYKPKQFKGEGQP